MRRVLFALPEYPTIHIAAILARMANHSIQMGKARSICCEKNEIRVGVEGAVVGHIPDYQAFLLQCYNFSPLP